MYNAVLNIINWFLGLSGLVFLSMTIYSGVKYILARGNKEKEKRAGKMFIYGLVILFILGFIFVISLPTPVLPPSP